MNDCKENILLDMLAGRFPRAPYQRNTMHSADAELIRIHGGQNGTLAITTDGLVEELTTGLYADPYLAGWMLVMANLSDLAAVGATPIGLLIAETLPDNLDQDSLFRLQEGIADAVRRCDTFVLGGDTNFSNQLSLTACAFGTINTSAVTRKGCKQGDLLFSSGPLGAGNGYAVSRQIRPDERYTYLPVARIPEGFIVAQYASACMDSSDGLIATLDELMRINACGFEISSDWETALDEHAKETTLIAGLPCWLLLAGPHGEYELIFTVPPQKVSAFLHAAAGISWKPIQIGAVKETQTLEMTIKDKVRTIDSTYIRDLFFNASGNIESCIELLLKYDYHVRMEG